MTAALAHPSGGAGSPVVTLFDVAKRYGRRRVLEGVNLSVTAGEVVGLVGPNGAGKTTLLSIVAGLSRPDAGVGEVLGQAIGPGRWPCPFVGIMPERPGFIEHLSGRRNLSLLASLRHVATAEDLDAALVQVRLDPADRRPVRAYSQGMRQRLALAQAIMEGPRLLLLDEPTNGLDPEGIIEMREIIRATASAGAAVLLASHLLGEVQAVCDQVMLVDGQRLTSLHAGHGREREGRLVIVEVAAAEQRRLVATIPGVIVDASPAPRTIAVRYEGAIPDLVRALVAAGVDVERVGPATASLEDLYLQQTRGVSS